MLNEKSITGKILNEVEQNRGETSDGNEKNMLTKSTPVNANGIEKTPQRMHEKQTLAAFVGRPILVSEAQFNVVKEEHLASMNLLNLSGNALLSAMNSMIPPEGSGRVLGEYTAHGMRQLAKSICDVIQTKTQVVRSMHQIARDEL